METQSILTHLLMAIIGGAVTLGGGVMAFFKHRRDSEISAGQSLREELRLELAEAKKEREELRLERERYREELQAAKELHIEELARLQNDHAREMLILKRALDKRDHRIDILEARVAELEQRSEPMEMP